MTAFGQNLRYGVRLLGRSPAFALAVVLTLALGIGANTAIFSAVNAVLLHPLPVAGLERLVRVYDELPGLNLEKAPVSTGEAADLFARSDLFEAATAFREESLTLTARSLPGGGEPRRVDAVVTMGRFFDVLGARPYLGRLYGPEQSEPGKSKVVVLGHALWQSLTGGRGDETDLGTLELDGEPYEILGVLPPDLRFPQKTQIWIPLEVRPEMLGPGWRLRLAYSFVGRLRPGISRERLGLQLVAEAGHWHRQYTGPAYSPDFRHTLSSEPLVDSMAGPLRPVLLVLMGAVSLVLLIACANVVCLQLVRAAGRDKELAVRTALGARSWSIVWQLLAESLVLAFAGGAVGLLLGGLIVRLLSGWSAMRFEALRDVPLDGSVLAFTTAVTLVAAFLCGIIPALRATRVDPQDVLKEGGYRAAGGRRQQRVLQLGVVVQFALTLVLLLASLLTVESLSRLIAVDPGFRTGHVMTMNVGLPATGYPDEPSRIRFFDRLLERLGGAPGVEAAGLVSGLPFGSGGDSSPFVLKDRPMRPGEPERHANIRIVAGDYFRTLGIPLRRGRLFDGSEPPLRRDGPPPTLYALIDETLARKYFGKDDPVGQVINQGSEAVIVGVVGGVRDALDQDAYPTVYYLQRQYGGIDTLTLVVRSTLASEAVVGLVRAAVGELDRSLPVYDIAPLQRRVEGSVGTRRLAMSVLAGFSVLSLLLAMLGVYGVISYGVSQRRREIGIRMALGAFPASVVGAVLRAGLTLAAVGAGVGTLAFLGLQRVLASLIYGIRPRDPAILLCGTMLLGMVAVLASWWPARRAARINPIEALREE